MWGEHHNTFIYYCGVGCNVVNIDWSALKIEYATTNISYRKLAEKHGISFNTLKDHALKDGWAAERKKYTDKVVKKTIHKAASKAATTCAKQLARIAWSAETATAMIERMMADTEQFRRHLIQTKDKDGDKDSWTEHWDVEERLYDKYDTKALKDFTSALKDLTTVIRNVNNLPTLTEQTAMDIAAKRLLLDEKKAEAADGDGVDGVDVSFEDDEIGEMAE